MKWITHQSMAVMAAFVVGQPLLGIASAWAGAVFPDILDQRQSQTALFRQRKFNKIHRRGSHWFGWWLALWIWSLTDTLGPLPDTLIGGFGFGALTHVLLDMCTRHGVPLWPSGKKRFSLKLCSTGSLGEYAILLMSTVLFWIAKRPELMHFNVPLF
jgi:inner membrane protein